MSYYEYLFYQNKSPSTIFILGRGKKKKKDKIKSLERKKYKRLKKEYKEKNTVTQI